MPKLTKPPKKKFALTPPKPTWNREKWHVGIDTPGDSGFSVSGRKPFANLSNLEKTLVLAKRDRMEAWLKGRNLKDFDKAAIITAMEKDAEIERQKKDKKQMEKKAAQLDAEFIKSLTTDRLTCESRQEKRLRKKMENS